MSKNIGKKISKNLSGKCSQKVFDYSILPVSNAFKTASKRAIQTATEATGNFIGNEINKVTKEVSRASPQNSSETVTNEVLGLIEKYICPQKKKTANYWWSKINIM